MVNVNEGKRAVSTITFAVCKNCGATVKLEDGKPIEKCCEQFSWG